MTTSRFAHSVVFFLLLSAISVQAQTSLTPSTPWGTWLIGTVQVPGGAK